jgi:hypothetical protein
VARRLHYGGRMRRLGLVLALLSGCSASTSAPKDIVGPFIGPMRRFYVSSIALPMQRSDFAADLNGDDRADNQLGNIVGGLAGQRVANYHIDEIVAARVIDATVDIISDDPSLFYDPTVGVVWNGVAGQPGELTGGVLANAIVSTNRVALTQHPAAGMVSLPLFKDADPTVVPVASYQLTLFDDGAGGFIGQLNGVVIGGLTARAWPQLQQMLAAHPEEHTQLVKTLDSDKDGKVSLDELTHAAIIQNVTSPDVHWEPGGAEPTGEPNALSIAFGFTLAPCIDDACTRPVAAPACHDRIKNGDEQQVDCGGSCETCF